MGSIVSHFLLGIKSNKMGQLLVQNQALLALTFYVKSKYCIDFAVGRYASQKHSKQ